MSAPMRVLVTGHQGYIGSVLTPMLVEHGMDVVGVDVGLYDGCTLVPDRASVPARKRRFATVNALPSYSCGPLVYKGSGKPDFIIASDLPLQGAIRKQTVQISRAMIWALQQKGWKAGTWKATGVCPPKC